MFWKDFLKKKSFNIKSSRKAWTTEELKKALGQFKVTIDKPSPSEFNKEFPSRSKKAIAHKLDFIDKKIRESLSNGDTN
ncbi:unnamed protein product [Rhizophagus irregularis]|nr:unnamed protein product [Rhizophagus irregularis]CAB4409710.1 unnamed protein product [Rhizophagus irregularis]